MIQRLLHWTIHQDCGNLVGVVSKQGSVMPLRGRAGRCVETAARMDIGRKMANGGCSWRRRFSQAQGGVRSMTISLEHHSPFPLLSSVLSPGFEFTPCYHPKPLTIKTERVKPNTLILAQGIKFRLEVFINLHVLSPTVSRPHI